jgi:hypothetical protein
MPGGRVAVISCCTDACRSFVDLGVVGRTWNRLAHMLAIMRLAWQEAAGHRWSSSVIFRALTEQRRNQCSIRAAALTLNRQWIPIPGRGVHCRRRPIDQRLVMRSRSRLAVRRRYLELSERHREPCLCGSDRDRWIILGCCHTRSQLRAGFPLFGQTACVSYVIDQLGQLLQLGRAEARSPREPKARAITRGLRS